MVELTVNVELTNVVLPVQPMKGSCTVSTPEKIWIIIKSEWRIIWKCSKSNYKCNISVGVSMGDIDSWLCNSKLPDSNFKNIKKETEISESQKQGGSRLPKFEIFPLVKLNEHLQCSQTRYPVNNQ